MRDDVNLHLLKVNDFLIKGIKEFKEDKRNSEKFFILASGHLQEIIDIISQNKIKERNDNK
jgi:hypothetical protein